MDSHQSLRICGALTALALSTAAVMPGPASATHSRSSAVNPTVVSLRDPVSLPVGAPPAVAYITGMRNDPIYRPGKDPLPVGSNKGFQSMLVDARGGYLVTQNERHVRYVSNTGASHLVFTLHGKSTQGIRDVVTSHDGRIVAIMVRAGGFDPDRDVHLVIRRIAHPTTIVQRTFHMPVTVAAITARRALLTPGGDSMVRNIRHAPTRWWTLRTDRLRTIDRSGRISRASDYGGLSAADLKAHQVTLVRGDHNLVVHLQPRTAHSWRTRAHEWVVSWSPDGRYVLTSGWTPQKPRDGNGWDSLSVRRASDGKLITEYIGAENLAADSRSLTWQDGRTLLVDAYDTCDHGSCANVHNLRCSLHGPCVQVEIVGQPSWIGSVEQSRRKST